MYVFSHVRYLRMSFYEGCIVLEVSVVQKVRYFDAVDKLIKISLRFNERFITRNIVRSTFA